MRYLSLFSGIEAATVAWAPLGWEPVAFVENDPFCCAVLQQHFPTVPNLGDITALTEERLASLGGIDLIVCGFPCQDVSVAGQRKGLEDADGIATRSGLFFTAMQLVRWVRQHHGCRWCLIENVPGLLSSRAGRDFATVVGAMAGAEFAVPRGGWRNAGVCLGPAGFIEWRTLDAEWFGVPQRRHRVFALADFGAWAARPPVLVDAYSLSGDPPPRRETGEDVAACLEAGTNRTGGTRPPGTTVDTATSLMVTEIAATLTQGVDSQGKGGYAGRRREDDVNLVAFPGQAYAGQGWAPPSMPVDVNRTGPLDTKRAQCIAYGGNNTAGPLEVATACNAHGGTGRLDFESETFIAMAFTERTREGGRSLETMQDTAYALDNPGQGGRTQTRQVLAPCLTQNDGKQPDTSDTGQGPMVVHEGMMVRRLTVLECERLQGLPDRWTLVPYRGKPAADSPRYRAIGNSFAVPVIQWIGQRIQQVEHLIRQEGR